MTTTQPMIEVSGLTKSYGAIRALDGVTFEVPRGEVLGFLGPNGAGKTTTMKILTCFIAPTQGQVKVAGHDVGEHPLEVRRKVGYLPENAPLYRDMRVGEYLEFVGRVRGMAPGARRQGAARVVERCGLGDVVEQEIRTLSKGYRQRAGLAQAMIHDPEILILDEPTSGLDPNQIAEIRELVREVGRERTVILSTHHLAEVQAVAGRVLIINKGRLVADGTPGEIGGDRGGTIYRVVLRRPEGGFAAAAAAFGQVAGVRAVEEERSPLPEEVALAIRTAGDADLRAGIFGAAVERGFTLLELGTRAVDLEAVFRRLTTEAAGPADEARREVA
jgi:ABC-2 type transport system ATP-binding protein